MSGFVVVDTHVLGYFTKSGRLTAGYRMILGDSFMAISFQTEAELLSAEYSSARKGRLEDALRFIAKLPHSYDTSVLYATAHRERAHLKSRRQVGGDAGDADLWIIASAIEYEAPLVSHDRQMVALRRALGHDLYTALPHYRAGNPA